MLVALIALAVGSAWAQAQAPRKAEPRRAAPLGWDGRPVTRTCHADLADLRGFKETLIEHEKARSIIGTPDRVAERVRELQARFGADELIVLTVAGSYAARRRSYELLAQAFDLRA